MWKSSLSCEHVLVNKTFTSKRTRPSNPKTLRPHPWIRELAQYHFQFRAFIHRFEKINILALRNLIWSPVPLLHSLDTRSLCHSNPRCCPFRHVQQWASVPFQFFWDMILILWFRYQFQNYYFLSYLMFANQVDK